MARADGARVFVTSGVALESQWDNWKDDFLVALSSFELVAPIGDDALEAFAQWEGGDPGFGVAFPATWRAAEKKRTLPGKSGVDIRLTDGDELLAYISVKVTGLESERDTTKERLLEEAQDELRSAGFQASAPPTLLAIDPLRSLVPGYEGAYVGGGRMVASDVETRIGFQFVPEMAFSITLISVTQEQNPLLWMRSKRAFELACQLNWKQVPAAPNPSLH